MEEEEECEVAPEFVEVCSVVRLRETGLLTERLEVTRGTTKRSRDLSVEKPSEHS